MFCLFIMLLPPDKLRLFQHDSITLWFIGGWEIVKGYCASLSDIKKWNFICGVILNHFIILLQMYLPTKSKVNYVEKIKQMVDTSISYFGSFLDCVCCCFLHGFVSLFDQGKINKYESPQFGRLRVIVKSIDERRMDVPGFVFITVLEGI